MRISTYVLLACGIGIVAINIKASIRYLINRRKR